MSVFELFYYIHDNDHNHRDAVLPLILSALQNIATGDITSEAIFNADTSARAGILSQTKWRCLRAGLCAVGLRRSCRIVGDNLAVVNILLPPMVMPP